MSQPITIRTMTRGQFLRVGLGGAAALTLVAACSGDDDGGGTDGPPADGPAADGPATDASPDGPAVDASPDAAPSCLDNGTTTLIASNHGHQLTVSIADVQAGTDKTYDIQGGATHSHLVTLTAAHFAQLAQNQPVQVTSTVSGHSHMVTVSCV